MNEPSVYLKKLSLFSRMLRREGLAVSPQETADACQILISLGFTDRSRVKTALRTVFAKSREEQAIFDRVFDGFFISEEEMRRQAQERMEQEAQMARAAAQAEEDLKINGRPMALSAEQKKAYTMMSGEERQRLRDFMEKYRLNVDRNPKLYGSFIHSVFAKALLEQQMRMEDAGVGCQEMDPELGILYRDISQFSDKEIPKAIAMLHTVTQRINSELTAKRRGGHSDVLDFRRTIRRGLSTGGSLYHLEYKKKRQRRKSLVVLCDVSASMMQFSEFALRLIQSLNRVSDSSRIFLFSESLFEADRGHMQNMNLFRNYVRDSGLYGKGTDLGTALEQLCKFRPAVLTDAATLLILSDTKTIDQPRAVRAVLEAKRQAGRILWLNPIPEKQWRYIRSIQTMSALCPMVACNTLGALSAACKQLALS